MPQEIHLAALRDFTCLAGDCPDNCCRADWEIPVDAPTQARWLALPDSAVKTELLGHTATTTSNGETRTLLAKNPDHSCVHLSADGLCGLQARYGEEYLPAICRDYPRIQLHTPARRVFSATLSCPEVVRLVMFGDKSQALFSQNAAESTPDAIADPIAAFLETLTGRVLAERRFPLNVRIYYLGKVLTELALLAGQGGLTDTALHRQTARLKNELYEINLAVKAKRLKPEPFTAGSFWKGVHDFGSTRGLYARQGSPEMLRTDPADNTAANYQEIHRTIQELRAAAQPMLRDAYSEVFETYLRVAFLNKGFPWKPASENYLATLINTLLPFAAIQLALWLRFRENQALTPNDVLTAIYKIERGLGHSSLIYDYLDQHPELLRLDLYLDCLLEIF